MDTEDLVEILVKAIKAMQFLNQHADEIQFAREPCQLCMRRLGPVLRGGTLQSTLSLACKEVQSAMDAINEARDGVMAWDGKGF